MTNEPTNVPRHPSADNEPGLVVGSAGVSKISPVYLLANLMASAGVLDDLPRPVKITKVGKLKKRKRQLAKKAKRRNR